MDATTTHEDLAELVPLELVNEGKTKKIKRHPRDTSLVIVESKDDITAGDGAKHDVIPDKGRLANTTACNVFRLLKACGVAVAFQEQDGPASFTAPRCMMLPYEVVVRREAHGSYLKRRPEFQKGQLFPKLIVEFFLKTKDKDWKGKPLVADDPLMLHNLQQKKISLFNPAKPILGQEPFLVLEDDEVFTTHMEHVLFPVMAKEATRTFLVLEKAWQLEGGRLVDFKVEFGIDDGGALLLADVIDNDSWRVVENGGYIDKQVYRDGGTLSDVAAKYARVAETTNRFRTPTQRIIIWSGSEKDKVEPFYEALHAILGEPSGSGSHDKFMMMPVICSVHKEPVKAAQLFARMIQDVPDTVVIAFIGRSNGAGPVISAMSTVPVITVPASVKDFPDDVWSSLRAPSNVPVMTVLEPANAILAALQILSARNPMIYAHLRAQIEARTPNMVEIL